MTSKKMKILLFDFDGTICNSKIVTKKILTVIYAKYLNRKLDSRDEINDFFDGNAFDKLLEKGASKSEIPNIQKYCKKEFENNCGNLAIFDGMRSVLYKLSKVGKLIIITSNHKDIVTKVLAKSKIDYIKSVLGSENATSKIDKIISIKHRYPDAELFYIGDTNGDMYEGKKAEVKTIAVSWGYHSHKHLLKSNPDYVVDSPKELLKLFKNRI